MQQLIDTQGKPLGVFLTMEEWVHIKQTGCLNDDWFHVAVQQGLACLHDADYVTEEEIKELFAKAGANVA